MKISWTKLTSRRAALMNQSGCRRGTTHKRVASSAGSNLPISYPNTKKVVRKSDVMPNNAQPLLIFAAIAATSEFTDWRLRRKLIAGFPAIFAVARRPSSRHHFGARRNVGTNLRHIGFRNQMKNRLNACEESIKRCFPSAVVFGISLVKQYERCINDVFAAACKRSLTRRAHVSCT